MKISYLDQVSARRCRLTHGDWILVAVKICIANSQEPSCWNSSEWLHLISLPTVWKFPHLSLTVAVLSVLVSSRLGDTELWIHSTAVPRSDKRRHGYLRKRTPFRTRECLGGAGLFPGAALPRSTRSCSGLIYGLPQLQNASRTPREGGGEGESFV